VQMSVGRYVVLVILLMIVYRLTKKPATSSEASSYIPSPSSVLLGIFLPNVPVQDPKTYGEGDKGEFNIAGERYLCPIGWTEFKVQGVPEECFDWPIAFHGTEAKKVPSILTVGLRKPGQPKSDGTRIEIPRGHIESGKLLLPLVGGGTRDFTDHVFLSPSIHYAKFYATTYHYNGQEFMFVFKARVRPNSYSKRSETMGLVENLKNYKSHDGFRFATMEWLVHNPQNVIITALLVKRYTEKDSVAAAKGQLGRS